MALYCNPDGKVTLRFEWEAESHYDDEDEDLDCELEDVYEADSWQEACDDAAACYDWDDEDVINFDAESELVETSRSLKGIYFLDRNDEWTEAPLEISEYYEKAEAKAQGVDE